MSTIGKIARRTFLVGAVAIAGGAAFGTYAYRRPYPNPLKGDALTPYVLIDTNGVTIIAPRAEMGQGIHTTLAALVAEELDVAWEDITVLHGPAAKAYYNASLLEEMVPFKPTDDSWLANTARAATEIPGKFLGIQATGGSTSIPDGYEKMRAAGATARAALIAAAARRSGQPESALKTDAGAVVLPDGTRLAYTDLAADAASAPLPDTPPLKPQSGWKLLGTSLPRVDMVAKSTGTAAYTADIRLPGMVFATLRANPHRGAPITRFDATAARAVPGVKDVLETPYGLAVIATNTWAAFQGAGALDIDWAPASYTPDTAAMEAELAAAFTEGAQDSRRRNDGDVEATLAQGTTLEAEYNVPHLAHMTMEPLTAAAWLQDGKLQIWAGNQSPGLAVAAGAQITGLPADQIEVHTLVMGGGFGRRGEMDFIKPAIALAQAMPGTPVLLTWTREEDTAHDMYRPAAMARIRARLDGQKIAAFDIGVAAPSVSAGAFGRADIPVFGPDPTLVQGLAETPYTAPAFRITAYRAPTNVPVGFWRSVGASQNGFFLDSAMDELAHLAGADPLAFRLAHLDHAPSRAVVEAVGEASGWGSTAPGRAKGIAFCYSFGVPVAEVIEVADTPDGIRLTGAWIAADPGIALDPSIIEAQLSGAMIYGLSAAITGKITFADGAAEQNSFPDADPLRMPQCPPVTVRILQSGGPIRGIGEPGLPPAAPALANAIFALTGTRHRRLPLNEAVTFA